MHLDLPRGLLPPIPNAFLVGGAVRDLILGRPPADFDVATGGDPALLAAGLARRINGRVVRLGIDRFNLYRVVAEKGQIDISPLQGECIEADLASRDFTINALACRLDDGRLIDCTGGLADLRGQAIRMVSALNLRTDPVRLLRAYRLAMDLGFSITVDTRQAVGRQAALIENAPGERIWAEWQAIAAAETGARQVAAMAADGLLDALFPELAMLRHCPPNHHHDFDGRTHSLNAYQALEAMLINLDHRFSSPTAQAITHWDSQTRIALKLALLLHDIGKPAGRTTHSDGTVHYRGHARRGADMAVMVCRRLKTPNAIRGKVAFLVRHHQRPLRLFRNATARAEGRFFRLCGARSPEVLLHALADTLAKSDRPNSYLASMAEYCHLLLERYFGTIRHTLAQPALINGRDLMDHFGLRPSPLFRQLLTAVAEARLSGLVVDKKDALRWVDSALQQQKSTHT